MEQVQIYHPDVKTDEPVFVPREEYDAVWFDKGWRLHPPKDNKKEK